jgi:hypothetical protein
MALLQNIVNSIIKNDTIKNHISQQVIDVAPMRLQSLKPMVTQVRIVDLIYRASTVACIVWALLAHMYISMMSD